jgi:hypothetical protein
MDATFKPLSKEVSPIPKEHTTTGRSSAASQTFATMLNCVDEQTSPVAKAKGVEPDIEEAFDDLASSEQVFEANQRRMLATVQGLMELVSTQI